MTTHDEGQSDRTAELRRALVATADAAPYRRPRPRKRVVIASIAAFALAGALTGGAVSAAAATSNSDAALGRLMQLEARAQLKENNGHLVGSSFAFEGSGKKSFDLGMTPAGGNSLVEVFQCLDAGRFSASLDSSAASDIPLDCSQADTQGSPTATAESVTGTGAHTFAIESRGSARYAVWLSWAYVPVATASPAQAAALSDGQVTRAEYVAAYNRYSGCLAALGYPLGEVSQSTVLISASVQNDAVTRGALATCYPREFKQVDEKWQLENEQTSIGAASIAGCLVAHGVTPAGSAEDMIGQLASIKLGLGDCPYVG
ncbi:MAG TPA: hypothetical protein VIJ76_09650 [Galbitalea sp.]